MRIYEEEKDKVEFTIGLIPVGDDIAKLQLERSIEA
jgi:hypothetical protein